MKKVEGKNVEITKRWKIELVMKSGGENRRK